MRTVSGAMSTHLAGDTTLGTFVKIKRRDGVLFGFSDIDIDIDFDLADGDGEIGYESINGYIRSNLKNASGFKVDNLEITGFLDANSMTQNDMRSGLWDLSEYKFFLLNYDDTSMGAIKLSSGRFGKISAKDDIFTVELFGLMNRYTNTVVKPMVLNCLHDFGDDGCKMKDDPSDWVASTPYIERPTSDEGTGDVVAPLTQNFYNFVCVNSGTSDTFEPIWDISAVGALTNDNGVTWETVFARSALLTVTSKTDNGTFTSTDGSSVFILDHFSLGRITWLTGNNIGLKEEIISYDGAGEFILFEPMFFSVEIGDTFDAFVGCDKHILTGCRDKFDNVFNYGGFPFIPGNDLLFRTPNAPPG